MSGHNPSLDKIHELTTEEQLDSIFGNSTQRPQLLFKHSLTCPISSRAHREYLAYLGNEPNAETEYHLVAVQTARPVSNRIAERTEVRHESPQALLVVNGEVTWHASHGGITEASLRDAIASTQS
ncbi:MAG: bacillithiol system redox-active protein YtxJ [Acidobacteriota bacterium]